MRSYTIFLTCSILATLFVRSSDGVACSSTITSNCTDCSDGNNVNDADCTTTTTTSSVTIAPSRRSIVRLSNLRYTNIRRVRVNGGGSGTGTSTGTGTGTGTTGTGTTFTLNSRRNNNRGRRGNIRVITG